MGRFLKKLWNGAKKVGRFIGKAADKVGKIANVLSVVPGIGSIASTVAKGAQFVGKIANGATGIMDKAEEVKQQYQPVIDKVKQAGQAVYETGIPDKLTGGGFTRVWKKLRRRREDFENRANRGLDRLRPGMNRFADRVNRGLSDAERLANYAASRHGRPPPRHPGPSHGRVEEISNRPALPAPPR